MGGAVVAPTVPVAGPGVVGIDIVGVPDVSTLVGGGGGAANGSGRAVDSAGAPPLPSPGGGGANALATAAPHEGQCVWPTSIVAPHDVHSMVSSSSGCPTGRFFQRLDGDHTRSMPTGRFAPSPTGRLHLGNLRTAVVSWLTSDADAWVLRMEDLDRVTSSPVHERAQLDDLAALGLHSLQPMVRQSERFDRYRAAIEAMRGEDRVYPCYCTRREIREAARAPHGEPADGRYPGTCRDLTVRERRQRERDGRPAALRYRSGGDELEITDLVWGTVRGVVDDVVLQRNDGVPAYNLAVVVDDAAQGVDLVVRGDDLLATTPRQVALQRALGLPTPSYAHVPLVVGVDGARLSKRHGSVDLASLAADGIGAAEVVEWIAATLGHRGVGSVDELRAVFTLADVGRSPVVYRGW